MEWLHKRLMYLYIQLFLGDKCIIWYIDETTITSDMDNSIYNHM